MDFIYFSGIDWDYSWQRPQALASRFARQGKVLYVGGFGLRNATLKDVRRVGSRLRRSFAPSTGSSAYPSLTVRSLLSYLPFPESPLADRLNGWLLHRALKRWSIALSMENPVVWIGVPCEPILRALEGFPLRLVAYDCMDNFAAFHNGSPVIARTERKLAAMADVVFATADELYERMQVLNPRTTLTPNATDYAQFNKTPDQQAPPPRDMIGLPKPILGYVGEIAEWFDGALVHDLALQHPDCSIVLIGRKHVDLGTVLDLPNVHFLGPKRHEEVADYVCRFDVCLLPLKLSALTSSVDPIKVYEYLASGKPVVSTPLRQVLRFERVVHVAPRERFADAVRNALETDEEGKQQERRAVARRNTWDQRVEAILSVLNSLCEVSAANVPRSAGDRQCIPPHVHRHTG